MAQPPLFPKDPECALKFFLEFEMKHRRRQYPNIGESHLTSSILHTWMGMNNKAKKPFELLEELEFDKYTQSLLAYSNALAVRKSTKSISRSKINPFFLLCHQEYNNCN